MFPISTNLTCADQRLTLCGFYAPWIAEHFVSNPDLRCCCCCCCLVVGCWLLVIGCWLLVVGCWLLVVPICKWIRRPLRKISGRGLGLIARARGSACSRSKLWIKLLKMEHAALPRFSLPAFATVKLSDFTIIRCGLARKKVWGQQNLFLKNFEQ